MAQKKNVSRERQIGKKPVQKKPLIDPRYKNTFWTVVIVIILIVFFIKNNTGKVPESGSMPPGYNPGNLREKIDADVPNQLKLTDSADNK